MSVTPEDNKETMKKPTLLEQPLDQRANQLHDYVDETVEVSLKGLSSVEVSTASSSTAPAAGVPRLAAAIGWGGKGFQATVFKTWVTPQLLNTFCF